MLARALRTERGLWTAAFVVVVVVLLLVTVRVSFGYGWGGFISELTFQRQGTTGSQQVIERLGQEQSLVESTMAPRVSNPGATNVKMATGTTATLRGSIDSMNNFPVSTVWFEWGYDTGYGNTTASQVGNAVGSYSQDISGYDPGKLVYYRFASQSDGINYSGASTFQPSDMGATTYNMVGIVTFIWVGIVILAVLGLAWSGMPLVPVLVIAAIAIFMGIAGVESILSVLRGLW